jgi:hypothetical protein
MKAKDSIMDLIFGAVIALVGIGFMYWNLTPDSMPDNLAGFFLKILIMGIGIVLIGFGILAIF